MPWIIDGHEDLAYNALTFNRDIRRSAAETRLLEKDSPIPSHAGQTTLGWSDYQNGQVAVVFGSIFQAHQRYLKAEWEVLTYTSFSEASTIHYRQLDFYHRLVDSNPAQFKLILNRKDLNAILSAWENPASASLASTRPMGLVLAMEGAEGIEDPREMEEWWQNGLRLVGLVWSGERFCGGSYEPGGFTPLGRQMLEVLGSLGYALDLAHMNEVSALQALDTYPGTLIATHANARALIKDVQGERHLADFTIRRLAERDGVMGILPFNRFLVPSWNNNDDRALITLQHVVAQIDHICQLTGSTRHVAFGTDFDGGFGYPAIPFEMNTIADLQKIAPILAEKGYTEAEISAIFGKNWQRILERILPD